mmetsp:Transcript_77513/g.121043  ORF Transcript_77513/g.121043 Transcript_77513/m.121043 type:complete len:473 (+) Transcript_77513:3-1421(+)
MIEYNPGKWSVLFAFQLAGSVLPKASVWAVSCCCLSAVLHFVFNTYDVEDVVTIGASASNVFGGFTFILGFLVVFRSQQAYARWWEGGTLLQQLRGEWFNAFSSLMAFCNSSKEKQQEVYIFQQRMARLTSLLYSSALQQVTTMDHPKFELIELEGFDVESMKFLDETHDRCEVVLQWIQRLVVEANAAEVIKIAPPILSRVYNQLGNGIVNLNNARKISDFPIPFPLAQMLSMMLMVHWFTIAVIAAAGIKHAFWATSLPFIAQLAYWSVNYIAVELENPFGDDPNDLPLQDMQRDLNKSLKGLLHPLALFHPQFTLNSETRNLRLIDCDFDTYVKEASFSDRRQRMLKRKGARKFKKAALAEAPLLDRGASASVTAASMLNPDASQGGLPYLQSSQQPSREVSRSAQEEDPQWISRPASRDESFKESDQWIRQGTGSLELNGVDDNIRHVTSTDETNCKNEDTIQVQLNR